MHYGGASELEALKMITLNPAKQLGIDKRTGSIEQGKDGDIVIWNAHPFSPYSSPDVTMIEGEVFFDRGRDKLNRALFAKEREDLEKLDVNRAPGSGGTPPARPTERRIADRDEADRGEVGGNNQ
jgi:adenine deaminase